MLQTLCSVSRCCAEDSRSDSTRRPRTVRKRSLLHGAAPPPSGSGGSARPWAGPTAQSPRDDCYTSIGRHILGHPIGTIRRGGLAFLLEPALRIRGSAESIQSADGASGDRGEKNRTYRTCLSSMPAQVPLRGAGARLLAQGPASGSQRVFVSSSRPAPLMLI